MVKFVSQPLTMLSTGTADAIFLESSDASDLAGPVITLKRNSPSPAQADYLGQLKFKGESDSGADRVYAKITAKIHDATNSSESGIIEFMNRHNGSEQIALRLRQDSFRTLNSVNLFVDGNTGLGQTSASERLDVNGNIAVSGTVDGRDLATDGAKLDGIEANATADQTAAEVTATLQEPFFSTSTLQVDEALDELAGSTYSASNRMPVSTLAQVNATTLLGNSGATQDNVTALTTAAVLQMLDIGAADVSGLGLLAEQDNAALSDIVPIGDGTLLGNNTGGSASPVALSATDAKALLSIANTDVSGLGTLSTVDDAPSDGSQYTRQNGAWAVATGGGSTASDPVYVKRTSSDTGVFELQANSNNPYLPALDTLVEENVPNSEITYSSDTFTVSDAGYYRIGGYFTVTSEDNTQRAQVAAHVYINGAAEGHQRGGSYIRNASGNNYDFWTVEVAPEIFELSANDTIDLRVGRVGSVTYQFGGGAATDVLLGKSRVWVEKVSGLKGDTGSQGPAGADLGTTDVTLTGDRTIDNGGNSHKLEIDLNHDESGTNVRTLYQMDPSISVGLFQFLVQKGSDLTSIQNTSQQINLVMGGTAELGINGQAGTAGQVITSNGADAAPTWQSAQPYRAATSPGNDPFWFDTSTGVDELFIFDSTRSKWLGACSFAVTAGRTGTIGANSGHFAIMDNREANVNNQLGFVVPFDCTLVAWSWAGGSDTSGWTHRVNKYDVGSSSVVNNVTTNTPSGTYQTWSVLDVDVDFDQGDIVGISCTGGSTTAISNGQQYTLMFKRRTS